MNAETHEKKDTNKNNTITMAKNGSNSVGENKKQEAAAEKTKETGAKLMKK